MLKKISKTLLIKPKNVVFATKKKLFILACGWAFQSCKQKYKNGGTRVLI